jgi:hypothetical protein
MQGILTAHIHPSKQPAEQLLFHVQPRESGWFQVVQYDVALIDRTGAWTGRDPSCRTARFEYLRPSGCSEFEHPSSYGFADLVHKHFFNSGPDLCKIEAASVDRAARSDGDHRWSARQRCEAFGPIYESMAERGQSHCR